VITYRLGINTCFAVKRWPQPERWAALVRDELGLDLVQHSLDLVDLDSTPDQAVDEAERLRAACDAAGLTLHSTFTGLAAYSSNLLLHPDPAARERARAWYRRAIDFTAAAGAGSTGGHIGAYSVGDWRDPAARRELWAELTESLAGLAAYARGRGLSALMAENLAAAREPSTIEMMSSLLTVGDEGHVPVTLCLDVGHQCVPGTSGDDRDPYAWLERLGHRAPVGQQQHRDHLGRAGAGRARRLRRHRRRAGPGGHPAVRAGRRPGADGPGPVGPVLARCPGPACRLTPGQQGPPTREAAPVGSWPG